MHSLAMDRNTSHRMVGGPGERVPSTGHPGGWSASNGARRPNGARRRNDARRPNDARRRRAAVVLEVVLTLPLLIIVLMAVVEFGLMFSNEQIVEMASRAGAQVASRLVTISESDGDPAPTEVVDAVNEELGKINVTARQVILEHNVYFDGSPTGVLSPAVTLKSPAGNLCPPSNEPTPPGPTPNHIQPRYVRVTVCVNTTDIAPNLLATFGLDFSNRASQQTTTRRYAR